jgi:hypothetical protein
MRSYTQRRAPPNDRASEKAHRGPEPSVHKSEHRMPAMRPDTDRSLLPVRIASAEVAVGGGIMSVGSFMDWASGDALASLVSVSGVRLGEGVLTLALGLVVGLIGIVAVRNTGISRFSWAAAVLAAAALVLVLFTAAGLDGRFASRGWTWVRADLGLYVVGAGAIVALIAAVPMTAARR